MVTFFLWMVQSAVTGGLGRLLLSCGGCCAQARVRPASTNTTSDTSTARFLRRIFRMSFLMVSIIPQQVSLRQKMVEETAARGCFLSPVLPCSGLCLPSPPQVQGHCVTPA